MLVDPKAREQEEQREEAGKGPTFIQDGMEIMLKISMHARKTNGGGRASRRRQR